MEPRRASRDPGAWLAPAVFAGRVALVTGAGAGIGAATARLLAEHGAAVALVDRSAEGIAQVADELGRRSATVIEIHADIARPVEVIRTVSAVAEWRERLDFVVNVAGAVFQGGLEALSLPDWDAAFAVNVRGPWLMSREAFPMLRARDGGVVINVSSVAGSQAYPGGGSYGPSKAALVNLTRQLAVEWATYGIRANTVSPGTTRKENETLQTEESLADRVSRIPYGRIAEPSEMAAVICFLLSPGASYLTGQDIVVDGALSWTVLPGPAQWTDARDRIDVAQ